MISVSETSIFLRVFLFSLLVAARNDVVALTEVITIKAVGEYSNKGEHLAIMKMTFVVIVVA